MLSEGEKGVYLALYTKKEGSHIREICRLAKLSLPAVTKHINKGESTGTISCERKGRLKICKLNFSNPKLISILQAIELTRFQRLPYNIQDSFRSFVSDLKERPLIALIFGSFAKNTYTKKSDLDVLLVFQRIDNKLTSSVEDSSIKIKDRTMVNIQPVSLDYNDFEKQILNSENEFMKGIRNNVMVLHGLDIYLKLIGRFYG
ncbi:MAG: nucleotidyltransferase domain-containing protein [Patescibacteria group bacterium]